MSLKKKLNRLKPHLSLNGNSNTIKEPTTEVAVEIPFFEEWRKAGVEPYYFDQQYCLIREISYPLSYQHGKYQFQELLNIIKLWNEMNVQHPLSAAGHNPEELFFFDTETTGLGGGTGNTIFLLGHARVSESHVTVKQHILPHPGAEIPLYQSFLESVDYKTLVTYNGKAFDWPQVKTRHTLIREHVPKLPAFGHFDLFHAARRMWKHRLEKLKLSIVEKEVLEFERKDDIPGFLAPMIYFDFVERHNPEGLLGVMKHNEMDILSLITLYIHLSYQLLRLDEHQTVTETYEVGRWYAALGHSTQAKETFTKLLHQETNKESVKTMHALALELKKEKDWLRAAELWQKVASGEASSLKAIACIELAKIYEHRLRNLELALKYCEQAMDEGRQDRSGKNEGNIVEIEKRLLRLTQKFAKERTAE